MNLFAYFMYFSVVFFNDSFYFVLQALINHHMREVLHSANLSAVAELSHELSVLHFKIDALKNEIDGSILNQTVKNETHTFPLKNCTITRRIKSDESWAWDFNLASEMENLFENQTVVDFGAGLGCYGRFFLRQQNNTPHKNPEFDDKCFFYDPTVQMLIKKPRKIADWKGYDGVPYAPKVTGGLVQYLDYKVPFLLENAFDWVICLEIGEYIPRFYETIFPYLILNHGTKGIVLSWQSPNGPTPKQMNANPILYMEKKGFVFDYIWSVHFRKVASLAHLKDSIYVFRREDPSKANQTLDVPTQSIKKAIAKLHDLMFQFVYSNL